MNRTLRSGVVATLALCATVARLVSAPDPVKFDWETPNRKIDPGPEERAFAIHQVSPIHTKYDANFNGKIDPEEAQKMDADAALLARPHVAALQDLRERKGPVDFVAANNEFKLPLPPQPKRLLGQLLLRRNFEDLTYLAAPAAFKKASGATLGFTNDRTAGKRTREAHGVLLYPLGEPFRRLGGGNSADEYFLSGSTTAIGIGLDMLKNSANAKNDLDLLTARLLHERELQGGPALLPAMYFRIAPFVSTDTRSDSKQGGIKVQWEPLIDVLGGKGVSARLVQSFPLEIRTRWMLQAEGGRVFDAGTKPGLVANSYFLRSGPRIKSEFFLPVAPFDRAALNFSWQYLFGQGTGLHDAHLIETALVLPLDEAGHGTFELTYRRGQEPANGSARIDSLVFSTGLKY